MDRDKETSISVQHLKLTEQLDLVCDVFEREWRAGNQPDIREYLSHGAIAGSQTLFQELLYLDLELRRGNGENPSASEYEERFPEFRQMVHVIVMASPESESTIIGHETLVDRPLADSGDLLQGKFQLLEQVGEGSFGVVYRALDTKLKRTVAIKLARGANSGNSEFAERFVREAKSGAQLSHPGIVPVFDVGTSVFGPYIVSEFVEGATLDRLEPISGAGRFRQTAELVAELADAIGYAHSRGIVHRDLKPGNVIVADASKNIGTRGRPVGIEINNAQLTPRILDFGLARWEHGDATMTQQGQLLGTPAYMSPEQAGGEAHRVDGRCDIYSLGIILYRLLSGRLPFHGPSHVVLRRVINDEPPQVRRFDSRIPKNLATICHKCIEKDPVQRYQTAYELADDLRRWLEQRPIVARPVGAREHVWRWCRRRPTIAMLVLLLLLVSSVSGVLVALKTRQIANTRSARFVAETDQLLAATDTQLPKSLDRVIALLPDIEPELRHRLKSEQLSQQARFRVELALIRDSDQVTSKLSGLPWAGAEPAELACLTAAIKARPHAVEALWDLTDSPNIESERHAWLRVCCVLCQLDSDNPNWRPRIVQLADCVATMEPTKVEPWARLLRPLSQSLGEVMERRFASGDTREGLVASHCLSTFFEDDQHRLEQLALESSPLQHPIIVNKLREHGVGVSSFLRSVNQYHDLTTRDDRTEETRVRQMANAALALISLGHISSTIPFYNGGADPRMQSYLIHLPVQHKLDPEILLEQLLRDDTPPQAQYALILALGAYEPSFSSDRLTRWLLENYRSHRAAAVHSACRWLLSSWGYTTELDTIDTELQKEGVHGLVDGRNWFHNSLGQCMIVFSPVAELQIGQDGEKWNPPRSVSIPWAFAVAATETTCRQYQQYDAHFTPNGLVPSDDCPVTQVSWQDAMLFCRWLNDEEQIPLDAMRVEAGVSDKPVIEVDLSQEGYRLPTHTEWEYACRSGSRTSRFLGSMFTPFVQQYAHGAGIPSMQPVGLKMPNQFGMFDMYGNADEKIAAAFRVVERGEDDNTHLKIDPKNLADIPASRGGSWLEQPYDFRSSWHRAGRGKKPSMGFRIARILPTSLFETKASHDGPRTHTK